MLRIMDTTETGSPSQPHQPRLPQAPQTYITREEAAAIFQVTPQTVWRWARSGRIPSYRTPTGRVLYPREWCLAYVERQEENTPELPAVTQPTV